MFGGLLKSTSLAALMAVTGVTLSGFSAQAADLGVGGNCCADLEERIAELEATTVRKGNRKVSLTVSGWVNEGVLFWDDGVEKNAYVTTNEQARSRFRFVGSAKIDSKWSAGYLLEIGVRGNPQYQLNQNTSAGGAKGLDVRHSAFYLQNNDLGKVWVGQTSSASDSITEINLANTYHFASPQIGDYIGGFSLRGANGSLSNSTVNNLQNQNAASQGSPGEGQRYNVVKYETPTLAGFTGSAAIGEDKFWDMALRYAGEFNGFKLAAGIAYQQWDDGNSVQTNAAGAVQNNPRVCSRSAGNGNTTCDELGLSASIMHVPTGLYATGAYGYHNDDNRQFIVPTSKKKDEFYYIQAGLEQSFTPVGKSTLFGEYENGSYGAAINAGSGPGTSKGRALGTLNGAPAILPAIFNVNSTNIDMWGIGFNQNIAAAAMDMYVSYRNYSFDVRDTAGNKANLNDINTVYTGARIQF